MRVGLRTPSGVIRCDLSPTKDLMEQVNAALGDEGSNTTSSVVQVTRHTGELVISTSECKDGDVLVVQMATHADDGDVLVVSTHDPDPKNSEGWMVVESPTSSQVEPETETCQVEDALCHEEQLPLLCFDLDGTLLHASHAPHASGRDPGHEIFADDPARRKYVVLRPGLPELMQATCQQYEFAVWTAAPSDYAEQCIRLIDEHACPGFQRSVKAVLSQEDCELEQRGNMQVLGVPIKPLRKLATQLRLPLHRVLVVDDNHHTYKLNISNALPVPSFRGEVDDQVLHELRKFLVAMPQDRPLDVSQWDHAAVGVKPLLPSLGVRLGGSIE